MPKMGRWNDQYDRIAVDYFVQGKASELSERQGTKYANQQRENAQENNQASTR